MKPFDKCLHSLSIQRGATTKRVCILTILKVKAALNIFDHLGAEINSSRLLIYFWLFKCVNGLNVKQFPTQSDNSIRLECYFWSLDECHSYIHLCSLPGLVHRFLRKVCALLSLLDGQLLHCLSTILCWERVSRANRLLLILYEVRDEEC